jgi:amino acid adenylation domain-containing protein
VPKGVRVLGLPRWGSANGSRTDPGAATSTAASLGYVVFTSGSTGRPKGVEIGHEALAHIVAWYRRRFGLTPKDRMPMLAGLGFDATVLDTWSILCTGGSLHVPPEDVRVQPPSLRDWMVAQELTVAFSPTILAEVLIEMEWPASTKLRALQAGGEALRRRPPVGLPFELVNLYGPSEAAVWVTHSKVEPRGCQLPPIGVPLDDVSCYVVDHRGRLCADRGVGELWLAGPQLGRGYRGLAERTAQSFPSVEVESGRRERVYRTGDLTRRGVDGEIHFIGRRDQQVKIRGYRIELGEISACLGSHSAVQRAVVVVRDAERGTPRLIAYVVPREERLAKDLVSELAAHAAERLPRYMLPAAILLLPTLPLTPNGKLDRAALPEPPAGAEPVREEPPTPGERRVLAIWRKEFGNEKLGLDDEFFAAGGHSLRCASCARLNRNAACDYRCACSSTPRLATHRARPQWLGRPGGSMPSGVLRFRETGKPLFCLLSVDGQRVPVPQLAERMRGNGGDLRAADP